MDDLRPQVWTSHSRCHGNNISYLQALRSLAEVAARHKGLIKTQPTEERCTGRLARPVKSRSSNEADGEFGWEELPVLVANGRTCAQDYRAQCSTPASDTSAMDGFAVTSALTVTASVEAPVRFRVAGIVAAGANLEMGEVHKTDPNCSASNEPPCVEIMTGARFPEQRFPQLDAVVKVEDVELVEQCTPDGESLVRFILVSAPVKMRQHRRPAGTDFSVGDMIIARGENFDPKHIMALTSVGVRAVRVLIRKGTLSLGSIVSDHKLSVGVLPTGSELVDILEIATPSSVDDCKQRFPDSNGPYIAATLRCMSASLQIDYMGPCSDDETSLVSALNHAIVSQRHDVLMTSGGVSMGRFDLVRKVLESRFNTEIIFHGCLIRPGAPVLFGVVNTVGGRCDEQRRGMTIVLGAPGNPIAAAMTVRFFLKPLLTMLQAPRSVSVEESVQMVLSESLPVHINVAGQDRMRRKPTKAVAFLLAKRRRPEIADGQSCSVTDLLEDQASYKIKPFLQADCWIAVPAGQDRISNGEEVRCYSLW